MAEVNPWLGPYKTGDEALDATRRSVAECIGADPDAWPDHKNAPLAIAAVVAIRQDAAAEIRHLSEALHRVRHTQALATAHEIARLALHGL